MLLVIDNYDSFTYNLVQYLGEMKVDLQVHRNDQISLSQIHELRPDRILISPGPCSPKESGLSNEIIRTFGSKVPLLGVCLGHQCIGHTFGANVVVNYRMMHGKTCLGWSRSAKRPNRRYFLCLATSRKNQADHAHIQASCRSGHRSGQSHADHIPWLKFGTEWFNVQTRQRDLSRRRNANPRGHTR